jgi:4-amino-4-deoxy-L-arabinose transferase-like glycosyltransferase
LLLIGALALAVRLVGFGKPPHIDELYHILAAQSLLGDGDLAIANGSPYTRAWAFTYLIAGLFRIFGDGVLIARLPALVGGVALVVAVFLWVRHIAGQGPAWAAAVLLALYPEAVSLSQFTRFYTLHALAYWTAALCLYCLLEGRAAGIGRAARLATISIASLAVALHFQPTTKIGIGALLAWAVVAHGPRLRGTVRSHTYGKALIYTAVAGTLILFTAVLVADIPADLWRTYRYADLWAEPSRNEIRFYHWILLEDYPAFWALFPMVLLLALKRHMRFALFCTAIFSVILLAHTFAAWKYERYVFYGMPFFLTLVGLAVAEAGVVLHVYLRAVLSNLSGALSIPIRRTIVIGFWCGSAFFLFAGTPALRPWKSGANTSRSDWNSASATLNQLSRGTDALVTSSDVKALFYLDRVPYDLSATHLFTTRGRADEFTPSSKTGKPMISTPASLARLVHCYASGLVIVEQEHWRSDWQVTPAVADYLESQLVRVPLPPEWRLLAFRWSNPAPDVRVCSSPSGDKR